METRTVYRFEEIPWHVPTADASDTDLATPARADEPGRKFLAQGDSGFYVQIVRVPPGFEAPLHSHDYAEVFMVLEGSCRFGNDELGPRDLTVVPAGELYGFRAGPDGVQFLVSRQGKAEYFERKP